MKKQRLKRLYAPYIKEGKRWYRAGYIIQAAPFGSVSMVEKKLYPAMFKDQAVKRYQDWLLAPFLQGIDETRALRPIPLTSSEYEKYSFDEYKIGKEKK